ncbi:hypothetical protein B9Z55_024864 [Caenorhabditis nigoni]|uniref:Uncharacterized protein n=1 Tax=Caenorhabditis nigoni TaxID=1611254 RepID=A0A2G5SWP8_9PELO|nr:hypothetical protein B9Z55_024864 [Caenorhabditis nigoni]
MFLFSLYIRPSSSFMPFKSAAAFDPDLFEQHTGNYTFASRYRNTKIFQCCVLFSRASSTHHLPVTTSRHLSHHNGYYLSNSRFCKNLSFLCSSTFHMFCLQLPLSTVRRETIPTLNV